MNADSKIEVSTVTVNIKGSEVVLSLDEAKRLRDALVAAFPINISYPYPVIIDRTPSWQYPIYSHEVSPSCLPGLPVVTCSN